MKSYTKENLERMKRMTLIQTAIKSKAATPSQAYSTKSVILIDLILKKQTPAPVPAAVATEIATEETPVVGDECPIVAPVVPFESAAEQQAIDVEVAPASVERTSLGLFKVNRKIFQKQLAAVSKLPVSGSLPVLKCVLLSFGAGRIRVEATNLDAWVTTTTAAETDGEGQVAVPHAVLAKFVAKCTSEFLMAEALTKNLLRISDIANKTEINGVDPKEFPAMPVTADKQLFSIPGKRFVKVLNDTIKCASTDETRYVLNGVAFDITAAEAAKVVATDGRRLAKMDLGVAVAAGQGSDSRVAIVPRFTAEVLMAGVPQDSTVTVYGSEDATRWSITAEVNGFTYGAKLKLVDATYPRYEQVIPKDADSRQHFVVTGSEFVSAIERLQVVLAEKSNAIVLEFEGEKLRFDAISANVGSSTEPIVAKGGTGSKVKIAANANFLREIVASWSPETFTISVKDELGPILLSSEDRVAVVMPCRLS